ncbi:MAG TPA: UDP-3-O-(3-hydroxymyristoyl)glucosamine N-acyltransferase [Vicinamibacterales bacterium]|nr:UDP-3-O-(3-hydroxymyristoyl)glucosamine N-acyltransferase [Vicinamibacterales bacterium]
MKLQEIADRLGCALEGDPSLEIARVTGLQQAQPGDLSFLSNPKYLDQLKATRASAVLVAPDVARTAAPPSCALLRSRNPYASFARALSFFVAARRPAPGIDRLSSVAPDACLGADVSIGPFVSVGAGATIGARTVVFPNVVVGDGVRIGEGCVIHSQCSIRDRVSIGDRVILHDGVVVGSDGFGFATDSDGTHVKIPQEATVVIEDDVEIGANAAIDRPAVGETRIGAGTKIDNLVHIAHGVTVGKRVFMAAQTGIAGSTAIEDDVMLAGQTGISGHLRVGRGAKVGAKSAVLRSVEPGGFVTGHPAIDHDSWRRSSVVYRRLPALKKRVEELEQRIAELEEKLANT